MNKSLLIAAAMAAAAGASAQVVTEPTSFAHYAITNVSPDGSWAVSRNPLGLFTVIDLTTGDLWNYMDDEYFYYTPGLGNCVSNTGIVTLSTTFEGAEATYFEDGELHSLPLEEGDFMAFTSGVTPDGSRIVGIVGAGMTTEDLVMQKPVVWERTNDGDYGPYTSLPYPIEDWTGRVPQYVTATCISDDGRTIVGQVVDYRGDTVVPIIYTEVSDGEWEYRMLSESFVNPSGVVLPEWPGEEPEYPEAENYMTPSEYQQYLAACDLWDWESGEEYPTPQEFMTAEEAEIYDAVMAQYEIDANAWNDLFTEFTEAYYSARNGAVALEFNSVFLSPDGHYMAGTHLINDFLSGVCEAWPVIFDVETLDYKELKVDGKAARASYVNDRGQLMAAAPALGEARNGYISPSFGAPLQTLAGYVQPRDYDLYCWMEENMMHDIDVYNPATNEMESLTDEWITGTPIADNDLTLLVTWTSVDWDGDPDDAYYRSYVMPSESLASIPAAPQSSKALGAALSADGVIAISGDAQSVEVFDINGRLLYSAANPGATAATGLKSGVYIIKLASKSETAVLKAVI